LTNYRICLVSKSEQDGAKDEVLVQVIVDAIASMELDDGARLLLVLRFDSLQYAILQDPVPPGPPATGEILAGLRRVVFGGRNGVEGRFPFAMGPALLAQEETKETRGESDEKVAKVANLWTAEEIYSVPVEAAMARSRKDKGQGKKGDPASTDVALGWTGGYDIQKEFERLRFRTKHW